MRIILALLFLTAQCFGATEILKTVKPSGGDYTSLSDAFSDNQQDLVANDKYLTIVISGVWTSTDTTQVNTSSYTTDSTHYVRVYTDNDNRAGMKWDANKYKLANIPGGTTIENYIPYITFDGIQLKMQTTSINFKNMVTTTDCAVVVSNSFIWSTTGDVGLKNVFAYNDVIIGGMTHDLGTTTFSNCTLTGRLTIRPGTTTYMINTIDNAVDAFNKYAGAVVISSNTAYKENTSEWTYGTNNRVSQTFPFKSTTDFSLTDQQDYGTSSFSFPVSYTTDILGTSWTAGSTTWGIGAFKYTSPAALVPFLHPVMTWEN